MRQALFLPEVAFDAQPVGDKERKDADRHHDDEEPSVTHRLGQCAGKQPGNHHRKSHEARTESIMARLMFTPAEIDHEKHIGTEAETITEVLDKHCRSDSEDTRRKPVGQIDIGDVGQRDGSRHRPQPAAQTVAADHHSADDAA